MDRREALKKIGIGGITVVGASSVLSSTAFADGGSPTDVTAPATGASVRGASGFDQNQNKRNYDINLAYPASTCPDGVTPTTVSSFIEEVNTNPGVTFAGFGTQLGTGGAQTLNITTTNPADNNLFLPAALNGYSFRYNVRLYCAAQDAWACYSYNVGIVYNANNGAFDFTVGNPGPSGGSTWCTDPNA